jgi:hypothetical protein
MLFSYQGVGGVDTGLVRIQDDGDSQRRSFYLSGNVQLYWLREAWRLPFTRSSALPACHPGVRRNGHRHP